MIERYLEAVSTYARDVDGLIYLIAVLVGVWFILCEGIFFYFIFKFRAKEGVKAEYITGYEEREARWIHWPHYIVLVCDVFIIVGAVTVWYDIKQNLPENPYATVRIVGQQWAWSFVHPGPDRKLDTADDIKTVDTLHIEANKVYHYKLEARDVMHSFSVPVFRLKQDAVPGRVITGWFEANRSGEYDIQCAEICGIGHGVMAGRISIESPEDHVAWMEEHAPKGASISVAALSSGDALAVRE